MSGILDIGDNGSAIKATADGVLRTKERISTAQVKLDPQPSSSCGIDNKSAITRKTTILYNGYYLPR